MQPLEDHKEHRHHKEQGERTDRLVGYQKVRYK